jgi:gliding motility-associated-like protein
MKRLHSLISVVLMLIPAAHAQNLVPNPDFSIISGCPGNWPDPPCPSQFTCMKSWYAVTPIRPPWEYHVCGSGLRGIPRNGFFFQEQKTGLGFIGIGAIGIDSYSHRTMAGCALLDSLQAGVDYYVHFYVNRREDLNGIKTYYDAIGAFFSDTMYIAQPEYNVPLVVPPPDIWASDVIRDTIGWEKVSGCYTARGGERYMVIGNMKPFDQLRTAPGSGNGTTLWYYIDDVGVYAFNPLPDTIMLCPGDSVSLSATFPDASIFWQGGIQASSYMVTEPGVVRVEARLEECTLRDQVEVIYLPPPGEMVESITTCADEDPVEMVFPYPGIPVWEDGSVSASRQVYESGHYQAYLQNECGEYISSYDVVFQPCECPMYLPSAFSPNFDGINEVFQPYYACEVPIIDWHLEIYDRWGNMVYREQGDMLRGWDGTFKGSMLDAGVYVWSLHYTILPYDLEAREYIHAGEVQLIR